jgi:GNAT superfamily N-acetyltransferase
MFGAFDGNRLAGFAIYEPFLSDGLANFAALYVSRPDRRKGIARELTHEVARLARADGALGLYVSATPTRGTVDFYSSQGFKALVEPDERMLALEPDDIHMVREL